MIGAGAVIAAMGAVAVAAPFGPLTTVGFAAVAILVLALGAGAGWLVRVAAGLLTLEPAIGLPLGATTPDAVPVLASLMYLSIELAFMALEERGVLEAPAEPPATRLPTVFGVAGGVGAVSWVVLRVSGLDVPHGVLMQIAGVAAAAATFALLRWLLRERSG